MNKDTKGKNNLTSYIVLVVILLSAVIAIFVLLSIEAENKRAKPLTTTTTTTTTARVVENSTTTTTVTTTTRRVSIEEQISSTTTVPLSTKPIKVTPFSASLEPIMYGLNFNFDYKVTTEYSGAKFNFNCTKYDEKNFLCLEGSGLMNIGTGLIPLYTYKDPSDNVLFRRHDYHIIVQDNYVVLTEAYAFKKTGTIKVYNKDGVFLTSVDKVLMSYKVNGKNYMRIHPTLTNNVLYYYSCNDGAVNVSALNFKDYSISFAETIYDAVCY